MSSQDSTESEQLKHILNIKGTIDRNTDSTESEQDSDVYNINRTIDMHSLSGNHEVLRLLQKGINILEVVKCYGNCLGGLLCSLSNLVEVDQTINELKRVIVAELKKTPEFAIVEAVEKANQ